MGASLDPKVLKAGTLVSVCGVPVALLAEAEIDTGEGNWDVIRNDVAQPHVVVERRHWRATLAARSAYAAKVGALRAEEDWRGPRDELETLRVLVREQRVQIDELTRLVRMQARMLKTLPTK